MISLESFTPEVRKYNTVRYLKNIIKMSNNNEGFISLRGNHVIFERYLIGAAARDRDRVIENRMKGIVTF